MPIKLNTIMEETKMKLVIVSGSKRKGNSEYIASVIYEYLKDLGYETNTTVVKLSEININYCTGCLACDETEKCNIEDDMTNLVDIIAEADGVVFISPVRWSLISGEMKTFLDRLNPLAVSMKLSGKKCLTIVIGQSEEKEGESVIAASASFKAFADNAEMIIYKQLEVYSCLSESSISEKPESIDECIKESELFIKWIEK